MFAVYRFYGWHYGVRDCLDASELIMRLLTVVDEGLDSCAKGVLLPK